jgi:hypothetical protein
MLHWILCKHTEESERKWMYMYCCSDQKVPILNRNHLARQSACGRCLFRRICGQSPANSGFEIVECKLHNVLKDKNWTVSLFSWCRVSREAQRLPISQTAWGCLRNACLPKQPWNKWPKYGVNTNNLNPSRDRYVVSSKHLVNTLLAKQRE